MNIKGFEGDISGSDNLEDEMVTKIKQEHNPYRYKPELKDHYIPTHLQIETVNGYCNARCLMCSIESWERKPSVLKNDKFKDILRRFLPIRDHLKFLTLHAWGEPLFDKRIEDKVKIASDLGFNSIGFASNCELMTEKRAKALLEAGLNTLICSLDGITKETHENIRVGLDYDVCHTNVLNFIRLRNETKTSTKILIRMIRQQSNAHEWKEYRRYWESMIDPAYGDNVRKFDVHNMSGMIEDYGAIDINSHLDGIEFPDLVCQDPFEKFIVLEEGNVALCDADYNYFYKIGNVLETDPVEIYNSEIFNNYRKQMIDGKITGLDHCKTCTIPRSRLLNHEKSWEA